MNTRRPIRHAPRVSVAAAARREIAAARARPQNYYVPPSKLPPKPSWLKLGVRVALLRPVSEKCAAGVIGTVYEFRPTEDGETWEVACTRSAGRRYRLANPQECVLWEEAGNPHKELAAPDIE